MITAATAARIWNCYREMDAAEKLLEDMHDSLNSDRGSPEAGSLSDAFGRRRRLQLGVPSGENSHRLFNVDPHLAISVINAHIANKQAELVSANEQARIELNARKEDP